MTLAKTYTSVADGAEAMLLCKLVEEHPENPIIFIARDDKRMTRAAQSIRFFSPETQVFMLPAWDCMPYDRVSPNSTIMSQRIVALSRLAKGKFAGKKSIIVTTINSVIQKIPPKEIIKRSVLQAKKGDSISRDELSMFLVNNGYMNVSKTSEPGEYSMRGSIVDIFPPGSEEAYRLDFFGDTIESLRNFNPLTQLSGGHCNSIDLVPASEILLDERNINRFREQYREMFGTSSRQDPLYEAVSAGRKYTGMEHWLPLFYEKLETLFDYVPDANLIFDHHCEDARKEREGQIFDYYEARQDDKASSAFSIGSAYHPTPPELLYLTENIWHGAIAELKTSEIFPFQAPDIEHAVDAELKAGRHLALESKQENTSAFDLLTEALKKKKITLIACLTSGSRERMSSILKSNDIASKFVGSSKDLAKLASNEVAICVLPLEQGYESADLQVFSEQDILGERIMQATRGKKDVVSFMEEAANLDEGEVVVHKLHGIGLFKGLQTLEVEGKRHDCLKIIYAGDDRLFVPVENFDLISRYGTDEENVQLDKLGGLAWQKRTAAIKKRIKVTAQELIEVAAQRLIKPADKFSSGDGAYHEFCSRFPYAETDDQLRAIEDVQTDLSSGYPMDRLICGDVGFGKTEIALRAAFLAAHGDGVNGGQVALITPTTLLARQHYKEFLKRFKDFPIRIRQLSRMVPTAEARQIREDLADGKIDIIVGTHALLAKNINFKKLSLLIIDEEQHFGVKQKERLKRLRSETHVLTMTATPIPRTLQLSMTGVRDLSLIATPPVDRLAIRTYVMPTDQTILREAILREHYRGGRTFYVCPRIADLDDLQKNLTEMVPEVKVVVAHGQMPPGELDEIMNKFYEGEYDVLLSTTIIESGIDIPEANTMIVHRADMFGLSQLYQLRGRVGRSNIRAYAYLTIPPRRRPTKQAMKRLEVMQKLDTLGAGFTLASYDMDIRGFGNLLGDEQSGNIKEVGVELYQQMLKETVESMKAQDEIEQQESFSPKINIGESVLIPEDYVSDLPLRLGLYRRIGNLDHVDKVSAMEVELFDRFGPLPDEVKRLLDVVKIKQLCKEAGIEKLDVGSKGMIISFHNNQFANPEALLEYVTQKSDKIKLMPDQSIVFSHKKYDDFHERVEDISQSLEEVVKLAA